MSLTHRSSSMDESPVSNVSQNEFFKWPDGNGIPGDEKSHAVSKEKSHTVNSNSINHENGHVNDGTVTGKKNCNSTVSGKVEVEEVEMHKLSKLEIVWINVARMIGLHLSAAYGAYLLVSGQVMFPTFLWAVHLYTLAMFGTTVGAHRYWSHHAFKAKTPFRLLLAYGNTISGHNSIWEFSRDHRLHHKYSETNADPYNAKRGFFFPHMGWLLARKHPAVGIKGKGISMSDLEKDKIVMFQKQYYLRLVYTLSILIPTLVPWYFWGESLAASFFFATMFRFAAVVHNIALVSSAAHLWGRRPYDKRIYPADHKFVAWLSFGEGYHNYHHVFPWDYKTDEVGVYRYNFNAALIDFMAMIGQAYDLKTVPKAIVKQRVARTGDGSHDHFKPGPWGWGDAELSTEDAEVTEVLYRLDKSE